jgi:hypothetical protein
MKITDEKRAMQQAGAAAAWKKKGDDEKKEILFFVKKRLIEQKDFETLLRIEEAQMLCGVVINTDEIMEVFFKSISGLTWDQIIQIIVDYVNQQNSKVDGGGCGGSFAFTKPSISSPFDFLKT